MTTTARNFKKNPHTASFLMRFHNAGAAAAREGQCLECGGVHPGGASCAPYEVPEHLGGGDGMVEINRGRVAEKTGPVETPPRDTRSEPQIRYMNNLIDWITEKDADAGRAARRWTDAATASGTYWTPGREGTASAWINRLKAKNEELNKAMKVAAKSAPAAKGDDFPDVPDGYYAVNIGAELRFYRFRTAGNNSNWAGTRFLKIQASDEFHPIRNKATRALILNTIRAMSPQSSMELYGQHIGHCGRCGRTLTDAESRARGIGPDCWGKM